MSAQFITTPGGEELAILPRVELEAIIEALEDRIDERAVDLIAAAYARGEIEAFPGELVTDLVNGENPVRVFRKHRGLTATELAGRAGLSGAYLSQIETGAREGTGSTLKKLAKALDVDVDLLLWG